MAKIPKPRDIEAALLAKGFGLMNRRHRTFHYIADGQKTQVTTWLSHSRRADISKNLIGLMARQCQLTKSEFLSLVDCSMSGSDYHDVLKAKKLV